MRLLIFCLLLALLPALSLHAQTLPKNSSINDELIYRINFGGADDIKVLLDKGANPNMRSKGLTALQMAIVRDDKESVPMVQALIAKGADVNAKDKRGDAPIIYALKFKQPDIAKMLLLKGADYKITVKGKPLIDFAKECGDMQAVKIIQGFIDKEEAYADSFNTPARFKEVMQQYAIGGCGDQYWTYFYTSRQVPDRDEEVKAKIMAIRSALNGDIAQIERYYTRESMVLAQKVSEIAVKEVFNELDGMVSNMNRKEMGIGSEADAKERCERIVSKIDVNIPAGSNVGKTNTVKKRPGTATQSQTQPPAVMPAMPRLETPAPQH